MESITGEYELVRGVHRELDIYDQAMQAAFASAAQRAKQTNTYMVFMEGDKIVRVPADELS